MQATTISSWALLIWKGLESYGQNPEPIFRQSGLDPTQLRDPNSRYPVASMTRLWRLAADASANPAFGLALTRFLHPTTLHALGYSWLASATLKEACERLIRYRRIVSDGTEMRLEELSDAYRVVLSPVAGVAPALEAGDAAMAVLVKMCRASRGEDFNPLRISLRRNTPSNQRPYADFFCCPIEFAAADYACYLGKPDMLASLPTGNAELAHANDQVILNYLGRFDRGSTKHRVETKLLDQLSSGSVSPESVAKALHMSPRTLQRKLREEGTSFKQLLDQTRRHLAAQYVRQSHLSVGEITFMLGFSEPANFSRAFKRWNGVSPSEYRAPAA